MHPGNEEKPLYSKMQCQKACIWQFLSQKPFYEQWHEGRKNTS